MTTRSKYYDTDEYRLLRAHWEQLNKTSIGELCTASPGREKEMTIEIPGLSFHYAYQQIDERGLELLVKFARTTGLQTAIEALFNGEKINFTEDRAVLHTALRDFSDNPVTTDGQEVKSHIEKSREQIRNISESVRNGVWKGATGKRITDVVHIGMGGSYLGPDLLYDALYKDGEPVAVHFLSNVDGSVWTAMRKKLRAETTLVVMVSKTFTTVETMTNAGLVRDWLLEAIPTGELDKHLIAVTAAVDKAEQYGVARRNIIPVWDWVGGRFSVWGGVGISVAIGLGYEVFEKILRGAYAVDEHFRRAEFRENIPVIAALISWWNIEMKGACSEAVIPYAERLRRFPAYLQQLMMESNGKSVDAAGDTIDYQTAPVIFGAAGTGAQHSFMQLLHQGTRIIPVDFIGFEHMPENEFPESHKILNAHLHAQRKALAFGKTADKVHLDMKRKGQASDIEKLLPYRIFEGNRPSLLYDFNRFDAYSLGMLLALYEHKIFVLGILWRINSFDQFGVELGKELADKGK